MTFSTIEPARAAEDDACHILDLGLCLDCIDAGECFAERPVMPVEPARYTPPLTPILSSLPIWSQLQCLHKQHADLKAHGQHIAARTVKEQAMGLVEGWFDGQVGQQDHPPVKHCRRCGFLNFAGGDTHSTCQPFDVEADHDADDMDQLAAARAQVSATLARWQFEAETTGIPF